MYAHVPPLRCASATTCIASVDFPDDSGPKISTIRPRGSPPMPRARSRARAPVGIASTPTLPRSPRRMMAPFPNCFSIWPSAMSSDLSRSIRADSFWVHPRVVRRPADGGRWGFGEGLAPPRRWPEGPYDGGVTLDPAGTTSVEFHRCRAPYDEHSFDASTLGPDPARRGGRDGPGAPAAPGPPTGSE